MLWWMTLIGVTFGLGWMIGAGNGPWLTKVLTWPFRSNKAAAA